MKNHPLRQIPVQNTELNAEERDVDANLKRRGVDIALKLYCYERLAG